MRNAGENGLTKTNATFTEATSEDIHAELDALMGVAA